MTTTYRWTQLFPATQPNGRTGGNFIATDTIRSRVVIAGANSGGNALRDAFTWDGTDWTSQGNVFAADHGLGRAVCWDDANGNVVAFGGGVVFSGGFFFYNNETWIWNGTTWTQVFPATSPPDRVYGVMAYCPALGQVVMFGGFNNNGYRNDTWAWDGTNWTQLTPATSPSKRRGALLVTYGNDVFMFGGHGGLASGPFSDNAETWKFNGTNWVLLTPAHSPSAREDHLFAAWPALNKVILYGGTHLGVVQQDMWEWNGTDWTQVFACSILRDRQFAGMSYDPNLDALLMFGGMDHTANYPISEQTWKLENVTDPVATTNAATANACSTATLNGTITISAGHTATVFFEYGTTIAYGTFVTLGSVGSGVTPVSTVIAGLTPGVTYHYRVAATLDGICPTTYGSDASFVQGACASHPTLNTQFHLSAP